jgi:hypothetical protein
VWFDFLSVNGTEYVSAYVAKDGDILAASCSSDSIQVRPIGANDEYPPSLFSGIPGGFEIIADLGELGSLIVNVTTETTLFNGLGLYNRLAGSMVGSLNGGDLITGGVALYEQFKLTIDGHTSFFQGII